MDVDESDRDTGRYQRRGYPAPTAGMSLGPIILANLREDREGDQGGDHLHGGRALERAQPLPDQGSGRYAAPNPAAQIAERLRAAMDARNLHGPGGRSGVETSLAETLQGSSQ